VLVFRHVHSLSRMDPFHRQTVRCSRAASYLSLIAPPAPLRAAKAGIAALVEQLRDVAVI